VGEPNHIVIGEAPPLASLKEVELETEILRAADRLEACASEYDRRKRPYIAVRLISMVRQISELVASETAWRKEHQRT